MLKIFDGFTDQSKRALKRIEPIVEKINQLEEEFKQLDDVGLRGKTDEFKEKIARGVSLDLVLPEAYALVREAAKRTIGLRHFDVQLMGGVVLHQGKIAEMKTGEGKTLVATLSLYLNALSDKGAHLVTVNDYLARRDAYWMGPVYHALGLSVAAIYPMQSTSEPLPARIFDPDFDSDDPNWRHFRPISRAQAYQADITYGTSAEFGFDYLRDNMAIDLSQCVQRPLNFAIVDEVDNLLIDEARTPLIISAPDTEASAKYAIFARLVQRLKEGTDYEILPKERLVELTDAGYTKVEDLLKREGILKGESLYDPANVDLMRHLRNALQAKEIYQRDRDYVVKNGEVIIVDEFTGRLMLGRRYSEGLHQAIEAKEGVRVKEESKTFATITIQNYFRMYPKLAGMSGTAATETEEFQKIYNLDVVVIPTNKPMIRKDLPSRIYKTEGGKFRAVVKEIDELRQQGTPILVGTTSIEKSEELSKRLTQRGIPHHVLNAKYHEKEAYIVAQAGEPGAVTVATNMAGRGVDIVLGGKEPPEDDTKTHQKWQKAHDLVISLGGLHVIGTEHHEARRIDNQLRGRAGRQGDPGSSVFYASLEDDLIKRFGGDQIKGLMNWAGLDDETPIENGILRRAIENTQKKVEGYHFDIRKHLVEYDDVINKQREVIYGERRKILEGADLKSNILSMLKDEFNDITRSRIEDLPKELATIFPEPPNLDGETDNPEKLTNKLLDYARKVYDKKEAELGSDKMRLLERFIMLRAIDGLWVEHLTAMDYMRQGIGLRAAAQENPLSAYQREGSIMFQELMLDIRRLVTHSIFRMNLVKKEAPHPTHANRTTQAAPAPNKTSPRPVSSKKIGRNDPCPCGSGKKYKYCCGK